jgi:hypothetical protein
MGKGKGGLEWTAAFLANQNGKDKVFRTLQYACRLLGFVVARRAEAALGAAPGSAAPSEAAARLGALEKNMSLTRKAMRWGKIAEILVSLRVSLEREGLSPLFGLAVVRTLLLVLYLLFDHLNYLGQIKVARLDAKYWSQQSARYWLWSIVATFLSDAIKLRDLRARRAVMVMNLALPAADRAASLRSFDVEITRVHVDIAKNVFDVPLAIAVGYQVQSIHNGYMGFCGTVSSLLGAYQVAEKI